MRRAKIIATLGPSSDSAEKIKELIKAGANVFRLNMSHGDHRQHAQTLETIRNVCYQENVEVGVLVDLQGPKIRVDKLESPLELEQGQHWVIASLDQKQKALDAASIERFIPTTYEALTADCQIGDQVLFDDGNIRAKAVSKTGELLTIEVITGGTLKSNKGINLPGVKVSAPSLTEKDKKDLEFALKNEVEYVALSFVRTEQDMLDLRKRIQRAGKHVHTIAKIEKPEAMENIKAIVKSSDMIMIARGDMGVELGNHLVPSIQKGLIQLCNSEGVPVITATQMLESMINAPVPTRAESSDVANAIWDGSDAVMLSGETAAGSYPVESVKMMGKIVEEAEKTPKERPLLRDVELSSVTAANQVAASLIAEKIGAKVIVSISERGTSCYKMTRFRPSNKVLGVSNSVQTLRRMCLYWGIEPYFHHDLTDVFSLESHILEKLREDKEISDGDKIVITHGNGEFFKKGTANSVRVERIGEGPVRAH